MCFVACILGGAEEHEEQSGGAGVVRDSAEALPEVEGRQWQSVVFMTNGACIQFHVRALGQTLRVKLCGCFRCCWSGWCIVKW